MNNYMDIFEKDLSGAMVSPEEPGYEELIGTIFDTMKTAAEMNAKGWLSSEEVHDYLLRITGREIDPSTTLLPPFYVDFGKNIRIGKGCWIQQGCTFFDRGGITIGDGVFIAPKVNLITINHDPNPDNRSATYGKPIVIDRFHCAARRTDRLRLHRRREQRRHPRCAAHDRSGRKSCQIHQKNRSEVERIRRNER